jgi:SHS2 domain-containing protein
MPFEEMPHTADWCLHVWAADLPHLFVESARGMNALSGISLVEGQKIERTFSASAPDVESLLVAFLSEMIYYAEHDHLAFDEYDLTLAREESTPFNLSARLHGAAIRSMNKSIKAVTYHNLRVKETGQGFEVEIVFDV